MRTHTNLNSHQERPQCIAVLFYLFFQFSKDSGAGD